MANGEENSRFQVGTERFKKPQHIRKKKCFKIFGTFPKFLEQIIENEM